MVFGGINYLAVVAAAVVSWAFGAAYYGALGSQWVAALSKSGIGQASAGRPSAWIFVVSFVAQLVMAEMLAGLIGHLGIGQITVRNAMISAMFCWVGFVMTTLITNHAFQGAKRSLTLIDGAHWLGVMLLQGLVLGIMGV